MKYCMHCMNEIEENDSVCKKCGKNICEETPAHHLAPGTVLNKKFIVGRALGEGGFGITYIGRDLQLDMKVAIKEYYPNGYVNRSNTISPDVTCSTSQQRKEFFEKGRQRFINEARVLARFAGEQGVVCVREFFEENSTAYIVMEYLEGKDLKQYIREKGKIGAEEAIRLLLPVMNSLTKIHQQGLIHRDISPDNIRLIDGGVKLMDFGAARDMSSVANKSLSVMLKPGYAPEEQYRSKGEQGPWTDVYALCATIYKCVTGITPDDATQRLYEDEVKAPSALGINIDKNIEYAIMKGMAVLQKDRYQSIEELIDGINGIKNEKNENTVTVDYNALKNMDDVHNSNSDAKNVMVKKEKAGKGIFKIGIILLILVIIGVIIGINSCDESDSDTPQKENEEVLSDEEMAEKYAILFLDAVADGDMNKASKYHIVDMEDIMDEETFKLYNGEILSISEDGVDMEASLEFKYDMLEINESDIEELIEYSEYDDSYGEIIEESQDIIEKVYICEIEITSKTRIDVVDIDMDYWEITEEEKEEIIAEYEAEIGEDQESYFEATMFIGEIDGEWKVLYFN